MEINRADQFELQISQKLKNGSDISTDETDEILIDRSSSFVVVFNSQEMLKSNLSSNETTCNSNPVRSSDLNWDGAKTIRTFIWDDFSDFLEHQIFISKARSISVTRKKIQEFLTRQPKTLRGLKKDFSYEMPLNLKSKRRQDDCDLFMIRKIVENVIIEESENESSIEITDFKELESKEIKEPNASQDFNECVASLTQNEKYFASAVQMTSLLKNDKIESNPSLHESGQNLFSWSEYSRMSENMAQLPKNFHVFRDSLRSKDQKYNEYEVERSLEKISETLTENFKTKDAKH